MTENPYAEIRNYKNCVPVAQLDRVAPSEGEGQAFESPQGRHKGEQVKGLTG